MKQMKLEHLYTIREVNWTFRFIRHGSLLKI